MKPLALAFGLAAVRLLVSLPVAAAADPILRIQPLGDSITKGSGSSDDNGWRSTLRELLTGQVTPNVDMIGSLTHGKMRDNSHEGHSGEMLAAISNFTEKSLGASPNVVLLHAGTNNMDLEVDVEAAPSLVQQTIDKVLGKLPDTVVIVAKIIWANDTRMQANTDAFNNKIEQLVKDNQGAGKHILMADMSKILSIDDLSDRKHPNDQGYRKMATVWLNSIKEGLEKGWIKDPKAPTVTNGVGLGTGDTSLSGSANFNCDGGNWERKERFFDGFKAGQENVSMVADKITSLRFADLDGDRRVDIISVDPTSGAARAWLSKGDGTWNDIGQIAPGPSGEDISKSRIEFADVNGDGKADYLIIFQGGAVKALLNNGNFPNKVNDRNWQEAITISPGVQGVTGDKIHFADLTGDGKADFIVTWNAGAVTAYLNNGNIPPQPNNGRIWQDGYTVHPGVGESGSKIRFADITGDGRAELLIVYNGGAVKSFSNTGNIPDAGKQNTWIEMGVIAKGVNPQGPVHLADLNGDGKADYLTLFDDGHVNAYINTCGWIPKPNSNPPGIENPGTSPSGTSSPAPSGTNNSDSNPSGTNNPAPSGSNNSAPSGTNNSGSNPSGTSNSSPSGTNNPAPTGTNNSGSNPSGTNNSAPSSTNNSGSNPSSNSNSSQSGTNNSAPSGTNNSSPSSTKNSDSNPSSTNTSGSKPSDTNKSNSNTSETITPGPDLPPPITTVVGGSTTVISNSTTVIGGTTTTAPAPITTVIGGISTKIGDTSTIIGGITKTMPRPIKTVIGGNTTVISDTTTVIGGTTTTVLPAMTTVIGGNITVISGSTKIVDGITITIPPGRTSTNTMTSAGATITSIHGGTTTVISGSTTVIGGSTSIIPPAGSPTRIPTVTNGRCTGRDCVDGRCVGPLCASFGCSGANCSDGECKGTDCISLGCIGTNCVNGVCKGAGCFTHGCVGPNCENGGDEGSDSGRCLGIDCISLGCSGKDCGSNGICVGNSCSQRSCTGLGCLLGTCSGASCTPIGGLRGGGADAPDDGKDKSCTRTGQFPTCTTKFVVVTSFFPDQDPSTTKSTSTSTTCHTVTACTGSSTTITTTTQTSTTVADYCQPTSCGSACNLPQRRGFVTSNLTIVERDMPAAGSGDWNDWYNNLIDSRDTFLLDNDAGRLGTEAAFFSVTWGKSSQNLVVQDLYGCIGVIGVSHIGAFVAHFWENPSIRDKVGFKRDVLDVLEVIFGNPNHVLFLGTEPSFFIMAGTLGSITKDEQQHLASLGKSDESGPKHHEQISEIKAKLKEYIPGANVQNYTYLRQVNSEIRKKGLWGKGVVLFEPNQNTHPDGSSRPDGYANVVVYNQAYKAANIYWLYQEIQIWRTNKNTPAGSFALNVAKQTDVNAELDVCNGALDHPLSSQHVGRGSEFTSIINEPSPNQGTSSKGQLFDIADSEGTKIAQDCRYEGADYAPHASPDSGYIAGKLICKGDFTIKCTRPLFNRAATCGPRKPSDCGELGQVCDEYYQLLATCRV